MHTSDSSLTPHGSSPFPLSASFAPPRIPFPAVLAPHSVTRCQLTCTAPTHSPYLDLPGYLRHLSGRVTALSQTEQDLHAALDLQKEKTTDERGKVEKLRRMVMSLQAVCDSSARSLEEYYRRMREACEKLAGWVDARRGVEDYAELDRLDGGYMEMLLRELRELVEEMKAGIERGG